MAVATTELQEHLASIHACDEARTWAGDRTPQQAWDESPRADWLLWWAAKTETNSRQDGGAGRVPVRPPRVAVHPTRRAAAATCD